MARGSGLQVFGLAAVFPPRHPQRGRGDHHAAGQRRLCGHVGEEQEVVALAADIVIEAYTIESALLRTEKLIAAKGREQCSLAIDLTCAYASDAADRVAVSASNLAAGLNEPKRLREAFDRLSLQRPVNAIAARRRVADAMIEANRYLW